jgi:hypothetical protein
MSVAFFQIPLSVQPKGGGEAELVPPQVLRDLNYAFVIVKEGGEKGIIRVEASEAILEEIQREQNCQRLALEQVETLQKSYPLPKLKHKYQPQRQTQAAEAQPVSGSDEVDDQGKKIIDTFQTVRSGFYLIDVPVLAELTQIQQ